MSLSFKFACLCFITFTLSNVWGSNPPNSQVIRYSIHEQHAPFLKSGLAPHENGILQKILHKLSHDSGFEFEPVWRKGQSSGEVELKSGAVHFIIDPPKELLDKSSESQIGATFLNGHIAVIKLANAKHFKEERLGYLNGISKHGIDSTGDEFGQLIAMQSFSEIHDAFINQQIDAAVLPLRLAQHYLLNNGLEEFLVIDRLLTKEPFTYKWLFRPDALDVKNKLDHVVRTWSNQDIARMMGFPNLPTKNMYRLDSWLHLSLLLFIIAILAMTSWIWHLRKVNLRNMRRQFQLKKSNHEAIQASHAKSNFLATVSHEIRTPMHAVLGVQELLLQSNSLKKDEKSLLQSAQHSANSLLEMLNQILDLSKIESGKSHIRNTPTNLSDLITHSVNPFIQLAHDGGVKCKLQIDPHIAESLLIDAGIIRQIIQNLLSNAIKFTPAGSINISCQVLNDTYAEQLIQITIADTGIGIPAHEINRLLEPYEQINRGTQNNNSGTGLGLAITSQLLSSLSSNLIIQSYPSVGTTVSFTLTVARSSAKPSPIIKIEQESIRQKSSRLSHLKALIVDDHAASLQVLRHQLLQLGLTVHATHDPIAALEIANTHSIDLLITDESMPNMNGRELASQFRKAYPESIIIGLTADIFAQEKIEIYTDAGMDELLIKPVKLVQLELAIDKFFKSDKSKGFFDFSKLKEFCGDDSEIQMQILYSILSIQRQSAELLTNGDEITQTKNIKSLAHKVRGGAQLIGAKDLIDVCSKVESSSGNELSKSLIDKLLYSINLSNSEISAFMSAKKHP